MIKIKKGKHIWRMYTLDLSLCFFDWFAQVSSSASRCLWEMGGGDEEEQLQADKVQQHLLAALRQRLFQEGVQQPSAEGERRAFTVHLQPQHQGGAAQILSI